MKCNIIYFSALSNKLEPLVSPLRFCLKSYLTEAKWTSNPQQSDLKVFKTSSLAMTDFPFSLLELIQV